MKDHPIIFSAPMVRALLDGRKTQTRRLATSPLRRVQPGDRLWVREAWKPHSTFADIKPRDVPQSRVFYASDESYAPSNTPWRPSIHMPRWASRLTLNVTAVRTEQLHSITDEDARAEGVEMESADPPFWWVPGLPTEQVHALPERGEAERHCYLRLWDHLHGAGSSAANPEVVVLTFTVEQRCAAKA